MFGACPKKENTVCAFCTHEESAIFCGIATSPNQIPFIKKCPLELKKKRVTTLTNWHIK